MKSRTFFLVSLCFMSGVANAKSPRAQELKILIDSITKERDLLNAQIAQFNPIILRRDELSLQLAKAQKALADLENSGVVTENHETSSRYGGRVVQDGRILPK